MDTSTAQLPQNVSIPPVDAAMIGQASKLLAMCEGYAIDSAELYEAAAEDLKRVKALAKSIEEARATLKKPVLEAGRGIDAFFKTPLDWLARAEAAIKGAMLDFQRAEERRRLEAAQKAAAEAEEKRRQILAEAERQRAQGHDLLAETIAGTAALVAAAPPPAPAVPKVAGIYTRKVWTATVTDAKKLIAHALANDLMHFVAINEGALLRYAQATQGAPLPGVTFEQRDSLAAGSR